MAWFVALFGSCTSLCDAHKPERGTPLPPVGSVAFSPDAGGQAAKPYNEEDEEQTHAAKGEPVVPHVTLEFAEDGDPEFQFAGFPALSADHKTVAYAMSDDDVDLVAAHSIVLIDTETAKIRRTHALTARGELAGYVERSAAFPKGAWQKRVETANVALKDGGWTALPFAEGELAEEEHDLGYQKPTTLDGLSIGTPDSTRPTWFEVRDGSIGPPKVAQDIKSWLQGRAGRIGLFSIAIERDAGIAVFKTRVDDEPYVLRIIAFSGAHAEPKR
jgi:hypothetical protein